MERLTKSNFVVDIYGFCGNSGLFEYADGGDIKDAILPHDDNEPNVTQIEKLQIGTRRLVFNVPANTKDPPPHTPDYNLTSLL